MITGFAAFLRFGFLDQQSFWFDEAVSVDLIRKSFIGLLTAIPGRESTPPLYYVLAWGWSRIFGSGEVGLRSLSALLGTATVPLAFSLGALFGSRRAGLFAAALVACSPFLVWYSQEARAYALLAFLSALSILLFERGRRRPTAGRLASWALVAALALSTHYFAVFLVAVEAAWLLFAHVRRWPVRLAVGATAAIGAALLPLALYENRNDASGWIATSPLSARVKEAVRQFMTGAYMPSHHLVPVLAALAAVLVGGLAWFVEDRYRRAAGILVLLGGSTVLGPLLLVTTQYDKFLYRNLIGAWVALAVAGALILASPRVGRVGLVLVAAACAVELGSLAFVLRRPALQRDDWRAAARAFGPDTTPRAVLTSPAWNRYVIKLYRPDVRALPPAGAEVEQLVFLGFARLPLDFRPPLGFRLVEQRKIQHIALVRYRSSRPRLVTPAELAARGGFSTEGLLWDR